MYAGGRQGASSFKPGPLSTQLSPADRMPLRKSWLEEDLMQRGLIGASTLAAALIIGVWVSGCGSSSSTTTTTTTTAITKAAFIAKGNAICVSGEKAQEAAFEAYAKKHGLKQNQEPTRAQQIELAEAVVVPNIQIQIDAVKNLGAPSGEEAAVSSALEASQQALNKVKANPELGFAKQSPFAAAGKQLHALGLTKCAAHT
jgi:hypothetical protein